MVGSDLLIHSQFLGMCSCGASVLLLTKKSCRFEDPQFESWGPLRIINEDRVEAGKG